jgi:hypothetical protein
MTKGTRITRGEDDIGVEMTSQIIYFLSVVLLWSLWKFRKIRITFFIKSIPPFLSLLSHIEQHGGISGQFLQTGLSVTISI